MRSLVPALTLRISLGTCGLVDAAVVVDLADIANASFDDDLAHTNWSITRPNGHYLHQIDVNPDITPLDPSREDGATVPPLTTPVGSNFVGIVNSTFDTDRKGKLTYDTAAGTAGQDTRYGLTVWANRGRMKTIGNLNGTLPPNSASQVLVQFRGWGPGAAPTVYGDDDWSRSALVTETMAFTNWAEAGQ